MKRIIICCDGTQNKPNQIDRNTLAPTNVVKIARAIKTGVNHPHYGNAIKQLVYYDQGVGNGWIVKRIVEGLTGSGLSKNILDAYRYLVCNYEYRDEIYLFGFSRGAFTVRSLAGFIKACGLLNKKKIEPNNLDKAIEKAFFLYKVHHRAKAHEDYFNEYKLKYGHQNPRIKFLGVWDTVASLGIPIWGKSNFEWNSYHNHSDIHSIVDKICHAVAIDEYRKQFRPTLFDNMNDNINQMWFVGSHSNIGGGYSDSGLSDISLKWMIEELEETMLDIDYSYCTFNIKPNPYGEFRNSSNIFYKLLGSNTRFINRNDKISYSNLHESVHIRATDNTQNYHPNHIELEYDSISRVKSKSIISKFGQVTFCLLLVISMIEALTLLEILFKVSLCEILRIMLKIIAFILSTLFLTMALFTLVFGIFYGSSKLSSIVKNRFYSNPENISYIFSKFT